MELRDYQTAAIEGVRASMRRGQSRVCLVCPTGSGKTRIAAEVVRMALGKGSKVLWLAHRQELVLQATATLRKLDLPASAIMASAPDLHDSGLPVQVASIQTLLARKHRPAANLIVWDECHHASEAAAEWASLLNAYPMVFVLGLTATPERGDGTGLFPIFTDLVVGITVRKLTEMGFLVPCDVIRPNSWLKKNQAGNPLAQSPVSAYRSHAEGRQGFLFARTVEEAKRYSDELTEAGVPSRCVHAGTPEEERAQALHDFRTGHLRILANVFVFTEGVDLPMASLCLLARGAGTAGQYLQMVGRILRPHPGKTSGLLIDLQGVSHVHGMPEDERLYKLTGRGIVPAVQVCRVCGTALDDYPCGQCGYAPSGDRSESTTTVTNDPLVRYVRKIAEGPDQRWQTLLRWLKAASIRGHSPYSVRHKWKAVYGEPLNDTWFQAGLRGRLERPT